MFRQVQFDLGGRGRGNRLVPLFAMFGHPSSALFVRVCQVFPSVWRMMYVGLLPQAMRIVFDGCAATMNLQNREIAVCVFWEIKQMK